MRWRPQLHSKIMITQDQLGQLIRTLKELAKSNQYPTATRQIKSLLAVLVPLYFMADDSLQLMTTDR